MEFVILVHKETNVCRQNQFVKFSADEPEIVTLRASRNAVHRPECILKDPAFRFSRATRPDIVPAVGLIPSRQTYLYKSVRPASRTLYAQDQTQMYELAKQAVFEGKKVVTKYTSSKLTSLFYYDMVMYKRT
ncbi:hypothetical protein DPMN_101859 [Dreissena polymorpha]|uniref:Uncharacterized protein n=1 Tax=Dreissena polymorpha TaxID=45954 RepID=A0A9D4LK53_DREPO|nr:hypothetical protein DPMN_101859 [Dreissena polymorpha]